jgi:DNA-binding SARP family transcriptional activator
MLRIGVLGRLSLDCDGRAISPPVGRPARTLLGWLVLHPGTHARATVAATLWPDVLDDSARGSLRVALVDLRRALGDTAGGVLHATREEIGLIDSPLLEVDARQFAQLLAAGEAERALALWRGELLEGLDAGDWLLVLRDQYRDERSRALAALASEAATRGDRDNALRSARERVSLDPFSEDAVRDLMRLLVSSGDRAAALLAYDRLAERLRSELRTAPSAATRELANAVRDGDLEAIQAPPATPPEAVTASKFGLPAARSAFVGRAGELNRLLDSFGVHQRLVMVAGEPGSGKTRLAFELAGTIRTNGGAVLFGRSRREPLAPYEPFVEAIREHVARVGAAPVARVAGEELSRLLPELRIAAPEQPTGEIAQAALLRLFEGVRTTLEQAAGERPLVLLLDDLHWADRSTVQLLAYLTRAHTGTPLTIVGTFRPHDLATAHPLPGALAELERERALTIIELRGLDGTATASIIAGVIGTDPEQSLVDSVLQQTGGNPFFVEQLARHLSETGALLDHDGKASLRGALADEAPPGVRALVRSRVERLGVPASRALALAAVAGAEFSLAALQRTGEIEQSELLDGLEAAEAAGLIAATPGRSGRWMFRHALVRASLYEELPHLRRARLHSRIADVLEQLGNADPAQLAHHAYAARIIDGQERAISTSRVAAEHAVTALAYGEASVHYQRALDALERHDGGDPRERCELLLALGEAQNRAADPEANATFTAAEREAHAVGDPELAARAVLGRCGVGITIVGLDDQRIQALQDAVDALGDRAPALKARMLARLAIELYYAPGRERAGPLARQAVQLARRADDPDALLAALSASHVALWTPEGLHERLSVAEELIALAQRRDRPEEQLQGRNWLCADLWEAGQIQRFERETAEHARLATQLRLPTYRWYGPLWQAALAALRADWDQANHLLAEAEQEGNQAGDRNAPLFASGLRLAMRLARHEFAAEDLELAERHVRESPASSAWRCLRCWFAAQAGNPDQANADLDWLAHDHFTRLPRDTNWLPAMFELTEAVCLLHERARAGEMYELILPFQDRHICAMRGTVSWGSAQTTLARLAAAAGNHDHAAQHYEQALEIERRWGARAWLVRTRTHHAELLINRARPGDREHATDLAREAIAQAHMLGMSPGAIPDEVRQVAEAAPSRS